MNRTAEIADNIEQVRQRITDACERANRSPDGITLVAVTKKMPLEDVHAAYQAGIEDFGENRIEEAMTKIAQAKDYHWHMIGHIQSRKAREVVNAGFVLVHSLDDLKLAGRYNQFSIENGLVLPVLLEVNVSGEDTKSGWRLHHWENETTYRAEFWHDVELMQSLPGLQITGLMTMAPWSDNPEQARPVFQNLARLREALSQDFSSIEWTHLSMGMTDDFEVAIEEGATIVRIGRAIFGERPAG